jgi:hypothetical protein
LVHASLAVQPRAVAVIILVFLHSLANMNLQFAGNGEASSSC